MQQWFRRFRRSTTATTETPNQQTGVRSRAGEDGAGKPVRREFLVIGLGRFGTSVANALVREGHDVLAVDVDFRRVQELSKELPHIVQIDATNMDALRERRRPF